MRNSLYLYLKNSIGFGSKEIEKAFEKIERQDFVLDEYKSQADFDYPLPIGFGQTISQPTTVAFMLNLLDPKPGEKILDVGSGSGWTTALLAEVVGKEGKLIGAERIKELVDFGNENLKKYQLSNAQVFLAEKALGFPNQAPFDRILVSAAAREVPEGLIIQLKIGGRLVIPVVSSIWQIDRGKIKNRKKEYPGFAFVPLIS